MNEFASLFGTQIDIWAKVRQLIMKNHNCSVEEWVEMQELEADIKKHQIRLSELKHKMARIE